MSIVLKVSTTELTKAATEVQSAGEEIKNITNQMTETINSLSGQVFEGTTAEAYKKKFNGLQDDINLIYNKITKHVNDLNDIASTYVSTVGAATAAAGTLSSSVIC